MEIVKENCPPGVTELWLSAWYTGGLGSAQRTQSGVEGLRVCAPLAVCTRVVVTRPMILAVIQRSRASKDGASLIHMQNHGINLPFKGGGGAALEMSPTTLDLAGSASLSSALLRPLSTAATISCWNLGGSRDEIQPSIQHC